MSLNFVVYQLLPYVALTTLVVGSVARYERDPFTWKSKSSQLLRRKQLMIGSILFHVGVLVIAAGHLVGLLTPIWVFDAFGISHGFKQLVAILGGGVAGVMALVGGGVLLHRRVTDPRIRANSTLADTGILWLLMAQLVLGVLTISQSIQHLSGDEMVKFMGWAQGLAVGRLDSYVLIEDAHWIFKLHLLLGMILMILTPFTRLVHIFSAPIRYLWRPGWQIVRSRRAEAAAPPREVSALAMRHLQTRPNPAPQPSPAE